MDKRRIFKGTVFSVLLVLVFAFIVLPVNDILTGYGVSVSAIRGEGTSVCYNLYGLIDVKKEAKRAYIGGFAVAMVLKTDGVIVDEVSYVDTCFGKVCPASNLKKGDFIVEMDGQPVKANEDIDRLLCDKKLPVTVLRGGVAVQTEVSPTKEEFSNKYRLGLIIRDYITGVGTVGFVKEDGSFGALGHPIEDAVAGRVPINGGLVYDCTNVGVVKSERGEPGEIRVRMNSTPVGEIYKNTDCGIFGKFYECPGHLGVFAVSERSRVAVGKAKIYSSVSGKTEAYDVEIMRALNQYSYAEKGLVLRVTDKRLLGLTGGIVQGMSGSPIVQNNMLVGVVTHVFINDPTKGYGMYLDFMYDVN